LVSAALTIVDSNRVRARDIEDGEVLGARARTGTSSSRVAKLISMTKVLKRVLVEKLTVPSLPKTIT
jgi:hypothetical protein